VNLILSILFILLLGGFALHGQEADSLSVIEENMIPAESEDTVSQINHELEIGQLIIDDTFSKAGNDFQQLFNTRWNWPVQKAEQFIITISEKPSFINSTIVEISINDLKVFESFLQPRYDILEETATQAIDITLQYILNYEEVVKELSGEDLSGSGIY
jgi:curli production assembly/transport component CsgE